MNRPREEGSPRIKSLISRLVLAAILALPNKTEANNPTQRAEPAPVFENDNCGRHLVRGRVNERDRPTTTRARVCRAIEDSDAVTHIVDRAISEEANQTANSDEAQDRIYAEVETAIRETLERMADVNDAYRTRGQRGITEILARPPMSDSMTSSGLELPQPRTINQNDLHAIEVALARHQARDLDNSVARLPFFREATHTIALRLYERIANIPGHLYPRPTSSATPEPQVASIPVYSPPRDTPREPQVAPIPVFNPPTDTRPEPQPVTCHGGPNNTIVCD